MDKVRFAVVGLGIGSSRADMIQKHDQAELACVCALDREADQEAAQKYGCEWTTEYDTVLERTDVDVVGVFTPSGTHADLAIRALDAGKHAVVTKPMDISVEKCDAAIAKAEETGLTLAVDFGNRYLPQIHRVKQAIREGWIGELILADLRMKWYRDQDYYDGGEPAGWRSRLETEKGSAANQGVHSIDLLQWFCGPVTSVTGKAGTFNHDIEGEDLAVGMLEFDAGGWGVIQTTTCSFPNLGTVMEFTGSEGTLRLDGKEVTLFECLDGEKNIDDVELDQDIPENIIDDMVRNLTEGQPVMVDGVEGRKSVKIFCDIYGDRF